MDNKTIIDYVLNSPENTNPVILNQMLDELKGGNVQMLRFVKDTYDASIDENAETGEVAWNVTTSIEDFSQYDFVVVTACSEYINSETANGKQIATGTYTLYEEDGGGISIPVSFIIIQDGLFGGVQKGEVSLDPETKTITSFDPLYLGENIDFSVRLEFCKYVLE